MYTALRKLLGLVTAGLHRRVISTYEGWEILEFSIVFTISVNEGGMASMERMLWILLVHSSKTQPRKNDAISVLDRYRYASHTGSSTSLLRTTQKYRHSGSRQQPRLHSSRSRTRCRHLKYVSLGNGLQRGVS